MAEEGVDYAFSVPSATGLAAAGKHFAGRYVGPGSASKRLTAPERDRLWSAGLSIMLLAEGATNDAMGGYNMGVKHGQLAQAEATALGAPSHTPIYAAVDWDVTATQWPTVAQYLRGFAFGVGTPQVGIYGGYDAIQWAKRDGVAAWFFQTYAWSEGRWSPLNHVEQYRNNQPLAGGTVDMCRAKVSNFGQWTRSGVPAATPGGDTDMDANQAGELHDLHQTVTYEVRNWTAGALQGVGRLEAAAAEDKTRDAGMLVAIQALATQLTAGGGSVDVAAITAAVKAEAATTRTLVEQLQAQLAAANTELAELRQALGAGAQAAADALAPAAG